MVALAGLAWLCGACSGDVHVTNLTSVPPAQNEPPRIIRQGPEWPSTAIDVARSGTPQPYIVVADPNGLDDISVALFSVDSAIVRGIIVRPDSVVGSGLCNVIRWSATLNITALLPTELTGLVDDCVMYAGRAYFTYGNFGWSPYPDRCSAFPRLDTSRPYFGLPTTCGAYYDALLRFGIYPPAVGSPIDVNVTYLDVEYRGLKAEVFDAAGASATATFPPLRLIYRSFRETSNPP